MRTLAVSTSRPRSWGCLLLRLRVVLLCSDYTMDMNNPIPSDFAAQSRAMYVVPNQRVRSTCRLACSWEGDA
jgi:hypothetical protein